MIISHCYRNLVIKNANFTLLLTYSDQEWQFHIATNIKWSRMAISHCYWHLVVKNGNFTLLLTSSGQEWQLADLPLDLLAELPPKIHHGIYIVGCIWQPFWILQEKVAISCYFWIIRLVNTQHCTVMSDVTPLTPLTPPWQLQISTMRTHICQV